MARGARMMGCRILRNRHAIGMKILNNGEFHMQTEQGQILAERVVKAAGTHARQIGAWVGLDLPIATFFTIIWLQGPYRNFRTLSWNSR